ncbi:MAG: GAF domain-containing protein [Chloroflexi bacterium]|nr:GAF domain-containing protein [Chloroflexota bacterium]MBI3170544.1 GAF domain-containing protein [Chloroflexota bacterium]
MSNFSLRNYLFSDATGKRSETIITLALGFVVTAFWALAYKNPITMAVSGITSLTALFSLTQTIRSKASYPMVFPVFVMLSVVMISILDGKGVHDLIWMSSLGVFLLVNIYSSTNREPSIFIFGVLILVLFIGSGLLELNGTIPNTFETDLRYILLNSALLLGIIGATIAVFHRHRAVLRTAETAQKEQLSSRERLQEINRTLEDQVKLRTEELNKLNEQLLIKTAKLQAAAEISQELLGNPNEPIDDLLTRTTRLISEKLGYYHVGVFLVDTARGFAVLHAANSKGGQEMLAKRHQLKIGGTGIVGYVSQSGRPRIALDTGADAVFFNNPYLPETRSEISLPIKFANAVIGVLDVQSTQSAAFNEEDTTPLMTIANQLAILLQRSDRSAVSMMPTSSRRSPITAWERQFGYSFRSDGTIASNATLDINPTLEKAIASGETVTVNRASQGVSPLLAVPVKFRDQVIGIIHIESSETNRNWTEDEIMLVQSISDRAALALENARLFENATRRAEQEETISRVTTQIGSSTDFDRIMQTTIQELGLALGASRSFIQIGSPSLPDEKVSEE